MGAQQSKSDDELIIIHSDKKQYDALEREAKNGQELMNEIHIDTVMSEQNLTSMASPQRITVANFAKIKTEPQAVEEDQNKLVVVETTQVEEQSKKYQDTENQKDELVSTESSNISSVLSSKEAIGVAFDVFSSEAEVNGLVLNTLSNNGTLPNISNIEVKKELLESHGVESDSRKDKQVDVVFQNSTLPTLTDELTDENRNNIHHNAVKTESIEDYSIAEKYRDENIVLPATDNITFKEEIIKKEISREEHDINQQEENHKETFCDKDLQLVKNPFYRKSYNQKKFVKQHRLIENKNKDDIEKQIIKSELIHSTEELNNAKPLKPTSTENSSSVNIVLDEINLNELIIKSETETSPDDNLEFHTNTNLNINCLSCNLNSSLDVNISNVDTDFDEALSTQSIEDVVSNISINSSRDSLTYYSIIEISSVDNGNLPIKETTITSTPKTQKKPKSSKLSSKRRPYKKRQTRQIQITNRGSIQKKRGRKPQSKTFKKTQRDHIFPSKKNILKNLPKTCIKTRKKANNTTKTKNDFPKPFKSEPQSLDKEHSIATELPKPMMFKSEADVNVNNTKAYLKPEFQPFVRLKRLKSEELLVPLKKKRVRKSQQRSSFPQMSSDNRRDFLIQNAFSLNQRIKLNRLSIDNDHSFYHNNNNNQPSLYSRLTTPYSMPMDTPNESLAEGDSKYFSPQELYSLFNASTPDGSSMYSGHLDSGVSTSTPSVQQPHANCNKTLLLEIAAERAFINNHLMHFGYSPVQFELFNNLNDLNVFLKYLFGSVNMN
ncbi:uncharacterized protein LOC135950757 [Calliphora vicina]|uniref:uncharacterized protein LOC135950757 n=1 Tax=Calliphora vicina TaxID=7373 RepID=UPI00325BF151